MTPIDNKPWRIISLDPGGTTGVCEVLYGEEVKWNRYSIKGEDHHLALWSHLTSFNPDFVVCEHFVYQRRELTKGVSLELISRDYIGVAKLYCQMFSKTTYPIEMQTVSQAKMQWSDANLKTLGLWSPVTHERDATRHALFFITSHFKDMQFIKIAKRPES